MEAINQALDFNNACIYLAKGDLLEYFFRVINMVATTALLSSFAIHIDTRKKKDGFSHSLTTILSTFGIFVMALVLYRLNSWTVYGHVILAFGALCNTLAVVTNGGFMPVSVSKYVEGMPPDLLDWAITQGMLDDLGPRHIFLNNQTRFKNFCDIYTAPYLGNFAILGLRGVFSFGDVLVTIGAVLIVLGIAMNLCT